MGFVDLDQIWMKALLITRVDIVAKSGLHNAFNGYSISWVSIIVFIFSAVNFTREIRGVLWPCPVLL